MDYDCHALARMLPRFSSLLKSRPGWRALLPRCVLLIGAQSRWDVLESGTIWHPLLEGTGCQSMLSLQLLSRKNLVRKMLPPRLASFRVLLLQRTSIRRQVAVSHVMHLPSFRSLHQAEAASASAVVPADPSKEQKALMFCKASFAKEYTRNHTHCRPHMSSQP